MSNIFKIKTPERSLVLLLITLNIFCTLYSTMIIVEQINVVWAWETIVSENEFVSSNCGKHMVMWASTICWAICFHLYSPNVMLRKGKFSWQHSKKISQTLGYIQQAYWFKKIRVFYITSEVFHFVWLDTSVLLLTRETRNFNSCQS